jgi:predicted dehydrogenase
MKKKKIKVGVVGIGHLGNYHLQKYQKLENCEITAVADVIMDRAQKAAEIYQCSAFADYRDMIGKVDAVSIAVLTSDHYSVARDFLAAGVDVLIEKPICTTLEEADELIELAQKKKLILQVGFDDSRSRHYGKICKFSGHRGGSGWCCYSFR